MHDWTRTRFEHYKNTNGGINPCICMQGGGAKGAWEAGVLCQLLNSPLLGATVALWGTSAGAINALWATTYEPTDLHNKLLSNWLEIAKKVKIIVSMIAFTLLTSVFMYWYYFDFKHANLIFYPAALIALLILLLKYLPILTDFVPRISGLLPIALMSKIIPYNGEGAKHHTYLCAADVSLSNQPAIWDRESICTFEMQPGDKKAKAFGTDNYYYFNPSIGAMASAGLPLIFKSLKIENRRILDGGMVANLPLSFADGNGALGGGGIICIVPKPIKQLDPSDNIDRRVLTLLNSLRDKQEKNRTSHDNHFINNTKAAWVGASHTHIPVFVICPGRILTSGLFCGFFKDDLLKNEFAYGEKIGEQYVNTLHDFFSGNHFAMDSYLLENITLPDLASIPEKKPFWLAWVNRKWQY